MTHPGWGTAWAPVDAPVRPRQRRRWSARRRHRLGGHRARNVALCVAGLVLIVGAAAAWLAVTGARAADALGAARADVRVLEAQARSGDEAGAQKSVASLQAHAGVARDATSGPVWTFATHLPWAGSNVTAVRTVAATIDDLSRNALPALVQATHLVDPATLGPKGGRVPLSALAAAAPQVVGADGAVQSAVQQLDAIDTSALVGRLATPVAQLRDQVGKVSRTTATASRAAVLLPAMLGVHETRTYLVLVQNNAEQRATGGIPGAVLLLRATDGRLKIMDQRSASSLHADKPVASLSPAEESLFGRDLGSKMLDVTFTPDFPRSAALAAALWEQQVGGHVDGVVSVDPVALAELLAATGPVTLGDGTHLSSSNAVRTLLNQVYFDRPDPAAQDAFFARTASTVFTALAQGTGSSHATIQALAQAAREGRVLVWSARADEQSRLAGTVLSGALRGAEGDAAVVGVYLEDGTQAKLGYYLDVAMDGRAEQCRADGSQVVDLTIRLSSAAPKDVAALPRYIVGTAHVVPAGSVRTNVLVYAPEGGRIVSAASDPGPQGLFSQVHDGLAVGGRTYTIAPGGRAALHLRIETGPHEPGDVVLRSTPTARQPGTHTLSSACGP